MMKTWEAWRLIMSEQLDVKIAHMRQHGGWARWIPDWHYYLPPGVMEALEGGTGSDWQRKRP